MEREKEVKKVLGDTNCQLIIDNINAGKIKEIHVKKIALKIGGGVHGVFEQNKEKNKLGDVWRLILDRWFEEFLFKHDEDGLEELIKILEDPDISLDCLAYSLEKRTEESLCSAINLNQRETKDIQLGRYIHIV